MNGIEVESTMVVYLSDDDNLVDKKAEVDIRLAEIKDFEKRLKKAASLDTQTIDDSIVMSLDVHARNPVHMWNQLATDYNTVTPAQRSVAKEEFLNLNTTEETCLEVKMRYNEFLRMITVQGREIGAVDRLETLLTALPGEI